MINDRWMSLGLVYVIPWPGDIPVPWQHPVLQQRADTARTGLLTEIPIQYLRLT